MALTTSTQFLWPPNWDGNPPENGGWKKVILHLSAICDTTGVNTDESEVIKLDISELRKIDGTAPTRTVVENLKWSIGGFNNVLLQWDRTPAETIAVLTGEGTISGNLVDKSDGIGDLTGDILLSTYGAAVAAVYDITLTVRLK